MVLVTFLVADDADALLEGFDDAPTTEVDALMEGFDEVETSTKIEKNVSEKAYNFEGKFIQGAAYSFHNDKPHDGLSSLKSTLFLEYNHNLPKGFKLKINANAFYDLAYNIKGRDDFSKEDIDTLEREVELFDAYVQGALTEKLDLKIGHQVVVWGKSDTIRITDVINPLDNRRPAMVDIEEMRLPTAMVKLDYYHDKWKISPIMIVQQKFNKNPPFGGDFNPNPKKVPKQKVPKSPSFALNVAGEFSAFDVDFYFADIYAQDELGLPFVSHDEKMQMFGVALNYVYDTWLFKGELAYKKDFQFLADAGKKYNRIDSLLGFEYRGIADTTLSYDVSNKHMGDKSPLFEQDSYQHAFRATSDFLNATVRGNYLITLFGEKLDKGGFQRAWVKYDIADGISANVGLVDYIAGSPRFDAIDDNDMIFTDIVYSF